jgi:oxygen-independent coproporphyrinogen-3 oxidase
MTEKRSLSSLYIHFPHCRHLCNYCDFYKSIPQEKDGEYQYESFHKLLEASSVTHEKLLNEQGYEFSKLKTLYMGGGTPSLWGASGANHLGQFLLSKEIYLDQECEFTLEVNPGSWTEEGLKQFQNIGVNRYSLGIQALDSRFLKVLDRVHNFDEVHKTLKKFNEMNANFSVDFMLGLPFSKEWNRDVISELKEILKYKPNHISLYILTVKEHYVHFEHLPNEEWIEKEYLAVSEYLQDQGFSHYEVSNFALPGKESQHNLRYWKSESVGAMGPSATGFLREAKLRYKWKVNSAEYVKEELTTEELALEHIYMLLRTNLGLSIKDTFQDDNLANEFLNIAKSWEEKGLASIINDVIKLSPKGYLLMDSLMDDIFSTLPESIYQNLVLD